jgi:hypothetical protein
VSLKKRRKKMKKQKILKLMKIVPTSIMASAGIVPIAAFTINHEVNLNNVGAAVPLSSLITPDTNVAAFSIPTPTKASILQAIKTFRTDFHNENEN